MEKAGRLLTELEKAGDTERSVYLTKPASRFDSMRFVREIALLQTRAKAEKPRKMLYRKKDGYLQLVTGGLIQKVVEKTSVHIVEKFDAHRAFNIPTPWTKKRHSR